MADRVHPRESTSDSSADGRSAGSPEALLPIGELPSRSMPPPSGTYVIQVPKDQIYRVPSEENAQRFEAYSRRALRGRRRPCRTCLICSAVAVLLLIIAVAAAAGILYLVFRPVFPRYSIDRLAIGSLNLTSSQPLDPVINVTVRAENPNKKVGIYYRDAGGSIAVSYSDVALCNGFWPAFYQAPRNVTVLTTTLRGSGIRLSDTMQKSVTEAQRRNAVPLALDVRVPVRVRFGAVTSWTITVKVHCEITVDRLTVDSRIVANDCKTKVDI